MPRYLLTPSLYDSWYYYMNLECKEKADFLNTLKKVRTPPTEPMLKGRAFEADIQKLCSAPLPQMPQLLSAITGDSKYKACVYEVASLVHGGIWQSAVKFEARFMGTDFLIYGRMDNRRRDVINDIKWCGKYEVGKYQHSVQHATYMIGDRCKKFRYIICDGEAVYQEAYNLTPEVEQQMWADYEAMLDSIFADAEFKAAFLENWVAFGEHSGVALNDPRRNLMAG